MTQTGIHAALTICPAAVPKQSPWWRRRSARERRLALVQTVALLVAVALAAALIVLLARRQQRCGPAQTTDCQSEHEVCMSPGCLHAASQVLSKMDPTVDPCDDFYQYACGNYIRTTNIPDDKSSVTTMSNIRDQLMEQLRNAIEDEGSPAVVPRHLQLTRTLYKACMDKRQIEQRGLAPFRTVLREQLGGWPVVDGDSWDEAGFHWLDSVRRCRSAGFKNDHFIQLVVYIDLHNTTRYTIYLDEPSLGLDREYLVEGLSNKLVNAYYQYQVDVAVLLGAERDRAGRELNESLAFEMALANIMLPKEKRRRWIEMYNPFTVEQLQRKYPLVPWLEYLQTLMSPQVTISKDEKVIVLVPSYMEGLEALLSHTPKRVVANYVLWRVVESSIPLLAVALRERRLLFLSKLSGYREREFRWKECLASVTDCMDLSVSSTYVRRFFHEEAKQAAVEMVDDIRREFLRILREAPWMQETTRKKALEKAESLVAHVAYPDELLDDGRLDRFYQQLDLNQTLYLESMMNSTKFLTDFLFRRLRQPTSETEWITHGMTASVNGFYQLFENSIVFPAGILQGAFFSADRPKYLNYGAIGFIIGYVTTHGFDDEGRHFDKNGKIGDWWDPVTREEYLKRAECIISQAGNFTDQQTGMHLDGVRTQGCNAATGGAVKELYRAYLALEHRAGRPEPRLPALDHLSPRQMLWLSFAQSWCSKYRTERLRRRITTELLPPDQFRVLAPLSNQPEFAQDFKCPAGSRMNPADKCHVW